ncbi:MAG: ECF transporter S component [Clostridia bacterium]|nr:ECF transporter S component [Clostridia bacterium]
MNRKKMSTQTLVLGAVMTALVALLQYMGAFIKLGPFSITLVLIPIVIGAATCGAWIGSWLGFIFAIMVFLTGDAAAFLAVNVPGTIITVLAKGILCGLAAGLAYKGVHALLDKRSHRQVEYIKKNNGLCDDCADGVYKFLSRNNQSIAVFAAAIICPLVNTGVFLLGCLAFFMETIASWAAAAGLGGNVAYYMIFVLVGANFLVELGVNIVLSPIVVRLLNIRKSGSR